MKILVNMLYALGCVVVAVLANGLFLVWLALDGGPEPALNVEPLPMTQEFKQFLEEQKGESTNTLKVNKTLKGDRLDCQAPKKITDRRILPG